MGSERETRRHERALERRETTRERETCTLRCTRENERDTWLQREREPRTRARERERAHASATWRGNDLEGARKPSDKLSLGSTVYIPSPCLRNEY